MGPSHVQFQLPMSLPVGSTDNYGKYLCHYVGPITFLGAAADVLGWAHSNA